jgi:sugar O-acyltransferase (sialic acid O-acetyltransferase NeuD family)
MGIAIVGYGGFAREIASQLRDAGHGSEIEFFVDREYVSNGSRDLRDLDPDRHEALIAIADPQVRAKVAERMPKGTRFYTFIHPEAKIFGSDVKIGAGSIICPGCVLTTNVRLGNHAQLNLHTTIGHDTSAGDYFTTAPGVRVSGNCDIGDYVYVGTNAAIREKLRICSGVTIGLMAGVVKHIETPGVYVGAPAKLASTR